MKVGMSTLEIYILQSFILEEILVKYVKLPTEMALWQSSLIFVPISFLIIYLCMIIKRVIDKCRFARLLIFGKKS